MDLMETVRGRRSVRSFDGRSVPEEQLRELLRFAESAETPYGQEITWRVLDAKAQRLSCPVITGTNTFIAGKMLRVPHAEEAFGFAFERVVLFAASLGLGTTWIGGTMDRPAFEHAMQLKDGEVMPCVSPLGFPAAKMSLRESMMRKGVKADSRMLFEDLFFDGDLVTPLSCEKAGELSDALEMIRLAPSAVNKQPWRVVVSGDTVYFYEKKSRGFVSADGWDMQKIDMGIAMCHFVCAMEENGRAIVFSLEDPGLTHANDMEFTAAFRLLP